MSHPFGISPHVTCGGGGSVDGRVGGDSSSVVSVIGRYTTAALGKAGKIPSMCHATHTDANYSSVFIGTPRPPLALWRALARSAGVHLYTSDSVSTTEPQKSPFEHSPVFFCFVSLQINVER